MKLLHNVFFILVILMVKPAHADFLPSFNPFTWFKSKVFKPVPREQVAQTLKEIAEIVKRNVKLQKVEHLYQARLELDDIQKRHGWVSRNMISARNKLAEDLEASNADLNREFLKAQVRWNIEEMKYYLNGLSTVKRHLESTLQRAEEELGIPSENRPLSWYEQLKKTEKEFEKIYNVKKAAENKI